jgi:WD40 repeat protein
MWGFLQVIGPTFECKCTSMTTGIYRNFDHFSLYKMPSQFLNIECSGVRTVIDVTGVERIGQVQDAIKAKLCNSLSEVDPSQLQLYSNSNKEQLINTCELLNSLPQGYFSQGGSCVFVAVFTPSSNQELIVWLKYLDEEPVRILLSNNKALIYDLKISFISMVNSPLSSASPGSIRISFNSIIIPSNKALIDFMDQNSYETPFLVSLQSIGEHISEPTATEKTEITNSVPTSEKVDVDGKPNMFSFNLNQAPITKSTPTSGKRDVDGKPNMFSFNLSQAPITKSTPTSEKGDVDGKPNMFSFNLNQAPITNSIPTSEKRDADGKPNMFSFSLNHAPITNSVPTGEKVDVDGKPNMFSFNLNQAPITKSTPTSEKGDADGKPNMFSFNLNQAQTSSSIMSPPLNSTSRQTRYSFKSKDLFDFGVTSVSKASDGELYTESAFDGSFRGHSNFIIDMALSREYLYSCSGDKTIKKWDLKTGKNVLTFGDSSVTIALSIAGDYLYSASLDKPITKWDPVSGRKVFYFKDNTPQSYKTPQSYSHQSRMVDASGPFLDILACKDYLYALSSVGSKILKYEVNTGHCISVFGGSNQPQKIHMFNGYVVVGSYGGQITFFDNDSGDVAFTLNPSSEARKTVLFGIQDSRGAYPYTISGDYLYYCGGTIINKYHINKKKHILSFQGHTDGILALVVSESFLFTSSRDNTIKKWDIHSAANLATISGHLNHVNCLRISDNFLYSGSNDCLMKKWTFDLVLSK